jgi:hypothetical protein
MFFLKYKQRRTQKIRTLHIQAATRKNEKERLDFAIETYEKFVAGELSKMPKWWVETSNLQ